MNYKKAISNIAWGNTDEQKYLKMITKLGATGLELAPSIIWDEPVEATKQDRTQYRKMIEGFGLQIISLHALLYTRPDLSLFVDESGLEKTKYYLLELAELADDLGARVMILGSPRNRMRRETSIEDATKIAIDFFSDLAQKMRHTDVTLCIEPLPKNEVDFINNTAEAVELVEHVNEECFQVMIDAKSLFLENEDYSAAFGRSEKYLKHIHVNDPENTTPGTYGVDHRQIANALHQISYDGFLSLEVGRSQGEVADNVSKGFEVLNSIYCQTNK